MVRGGRPMSACCGPGREGTDATDADVERDLERIVPASAR